MNKIKVKRGEIVDIISGNDKGKSGKILMISKDQKKSSSWRNKFY